MKILFNKFPVDIIICIICCFIIIPIILLNINDKLKIVLGLPFLLFIPGYLLLFIIFPSKKTDHGIDFTDRIALSFGLSLAIVAFIGIVLYYTIGLIESGNALISIFIFEIITGVISIYRWFKTPHDERLALSINIKLKNNFSSKNKLNKILIIILITLIVISNILFIYVITTPRLGEKYTTFAIFGLDKSTTNLPRNIIARENTTIIISITNHEYQTLNYSVEIWLINQTITYNESSKENITSYNNAWFLNKINIRLNHTDKNTNMEWESQWEYNYNFNITNKGENLTLVFLLFKTPTDNFDYFKDYKDIIEQQIDNSYEDLHIWINVK